ncbi:DNA repair protein XRCC2 [Ischnura elegans]|uniref:DNA repair protein XRCC2 n=1 Tax=Ischnura elegans TaxID=197161 RepID=UPI001ED86B38|nr:DNA repair protein XRCC2 [Ischnura elegans]
MNYECKAETGIQLLARSGTRPKVKGIDQSLFFRDVSCSPDNGDTLEVSGDGSVGKTLFVTQLMAQCILPRRIIVDGVDIHVGGLDAGAVFINTDHHFQIPKLVQIMEQRLRNCKINKSDAELSQIMEKHMENGLTKLMILNCYDSAQLMATFFSLEKHLSDNRSVALVVLDSATAFYWQDVCSSNVSDKRMDSYLKSVLSTFEKCVKGSSVLIVYTRPKYFYSKNPVNVKNPGPSSSGEKHKFTIQLSHLEADEEKILLNSDRLSAVKCKAVINTPKSSFECRYYISSQGIMYPDKDGD